MSVFGDSKKSASLRQLVDYDGDGDLDVYAGGDIVYENDGRVSPSFTARRLTFSLPASLAGMEWVNIVLWHDFDHDGLPDIIFICYTDDGYGQGVCFGRNLGKGAYACQLLCYEHDWYTEYTWTYYSFDQFSLADLDNDGNMELIFVYNWTYRDDAYYRCDYSDVLCMRYLGGAEPAFSRAVSLTPSKKEMVTPYALADLNGDGILDIVNLEYDSANQPWWPEPELVARIRTVKSVNSYTTGTVIRAYDNDAFPTQLSLTPLDFDHDGQMEILVSGGEDASHEAGYIKNTDYFKLYQGSSVSWETALVDSEHPGLWNLLMNKADGVWGMQYDPGTSTRTLERLLFPASIPYILGAERHLFPRRKPAFLLQTGNYGQYQDLRYYPDTGGQLLTGYPVYGSTAWSYDTGGEMTYVMGDLNGDGFPDLLIRDPASGIYFLPNIDSQNFAPHTLASPQTGPEAVWPVDWDRDGRIDVIAALSGKDRINLIHNNGGAVPTFNASILADEVPKPMDLCAADLDRDGKLEIVAACQGDGSIDWFSQAAAPGAMMTKHVLTTQAAGARAVATADLDKDGDLDILAASVDNNTFWWFENNGARPPVFTAHKLSTQYAGARTITAADLDGDGDLDVLGAARDGHTVLWFENNGQKPPVFILHVVDSAAGAVNCLAAADLDGDGAMEVVAGSSADNTIAWYDGNGAHPPVFTKHLISSKASGVRSLVISDFNCDGYSDILAVQGGDAAIVWFINDGARPPHFTRRAVGVQQGSLAGAAVADLNGDGYPDVIGTLPAKTTIAWFENLMGRPQPYAAARGWGMYH